MPETIEQVKARLSSRYLGRSGIHAIGIRPGGIVAVYLSGVLSDHAKQILRNLEADALPYAIRVIEEPPATLATAAQTPKE